MADLLSTVQLTHHKWLNLFKTTYRNNAGRIGEWIFASRGRDNFNEPLNKPNAVTIVPIWNHEGERRLVLTKEFRIPLEAHEYGFPAGLLEKDESIEDCVRRELKEETGFGLLRVIRTSPMLASSAGMTDETSVMVFVECEYGSAQQLEDDEDIQVVSLTHAEVRKWVKKPLMYSAKAWPVLLMFEQMGSLEMK
jgi:ADP-ribose pyrophosphatase